MSLDPRQTERIRPWIMRLCVLLFIINLIALIWVTMHEPPMGVKARVRNNLGRAYQDAGRLVEAEEQFMLAIQRVPQYSHPHINMGILRETEGRHKEALIFFRRALEIEPGSVLAHYNLGTCLYMSGHPDEAIGEFGIVVKMGTMAAEAYNNIGYIRANQGREQEALTAFASAMKADPDMAAPAVNYQIIKNRMLDG